ncbi:MAG: hypothetical protein H0W15_09575 [Gemmatimonadales bacterium]|nr:hypothetical protein [Gemmatimonadales bacterium]
MESPPHRALPAAAYALGGVSGLLLALQIWTIALWSAAFAAASTQGERVDYYLAHFPLGLGRLGASNLTWLSAGVGTVGFVAAVVAARRLTGAGRALSIGLAVANAVLVLWYGFTMM